MVDPTQAAKVPDCRFTILGHAALLVETPDCSILADPWLVGSCYWRSWWLYPPPPARLVRALKPDYLLITHLHWDHFQGVSLRRFPTTTPVLVPRAHFDRMAEDLRSLGFNRIIEVAHGETRRLGPRTSVTSWQFGLALDSAWVVRAGETTLLNVNDCKLMGLPLRQVVRRHPRIDFVFRSHSSASPYPLCVTSDVSGQAAPRDNDHYSREFLAFARAVRARHAIPFASNHCFLHPETKRFNDTIVSPLEVKAHFDAKRRGAAECHVMLPGDSWSSGTGFSIAGGDWFTRREEHLARLERRHAPALERCARDEAAVEPDWPAFRRYFADLMKRLPPGFGRLFPARILFNVRAARPAAWLLDFRRGTVSDAPDGPPADLRVDVAAAVLRDCCRKRLFSTFTASKRVHFHVQTSRGLRYFFMFTQLLDVGESGYLPLSGWLRPRFWTAWFRRWREILFYLYLLAGVAIRRPRLRPSDHF